LERTNSEIGSRKIGLVMLRNKLRDSCLFEPQVKVRLKIFLLGSDLVICHFFSKQFQEMTANLLPNQTAHAIKSLQSGSSLVESPIFEDEEDREMEPSMQCDVEP
jgi:hypothetical protein